MSSNSTKILYRWWDPDRTDNHTTTHPSWIGGPGDSRTPNYRFASAEGRVCDPEHPPPPETTPLSKWWDPDRTDNHTTTHPSWIGEPGDTRTPNYGFARLEGHVYNRPLAGTWPLYRWWSAGRTDNHTTTRWLPDEDGRHTPDYDRSRLEGFIMPVDDQLSPFPSYMAGYRPNVLTGTRPLLVILVEFSDAELKNGDSFYESLVFGPDGINLADYFSEISARKFLWTKAGVCRVSFPRTAAVELADPQWSKRLMRQVAAFGFDYARFDSDGDGLVTKEDLGVLRIVSTYKPEYRAGGQTAALPPMTIGGTRLGLSSSNCDEQGDIVLYAHELTHQLMGSEHIYGPGARLNYKASLFAGNSSIDRADAGPVHLDPWHKIRYGWLEPRVVPITLSGGVAIINAAQSGSPYDDSRAPLVFYDPERGTGEFFIVEYRTPSTPMHPDGGYDATVLGQGVAVWYVQREADGTTPTFDWPPPVVPIAGGDMWANYLVGPNGPGLGPFWTDANGEFSLPWGDGTESALRPRVGPMSDSSPYAIVQWRHRDHPFLPRIDEVTPGEAGPGAHLALDGVFGVRDDEARVVLESDGGERALAIQSWSPTRVTVRVGDDVDPGSYRIRVFSDATSSSGGNPVDFGVEA